MISRILGRLTRAWAAPAAAGSRRPAPRASAGEAISLTDSAAIEAWLRQGGGGASGASVSAESAMRVAAVYGCVKILSEAIASIPLELKRRAPRGFEDAEDHPLWELLAERPNDWQSAFEFRRMMQTRVLLRGNAYARIVRNGRRVTHLEPITAAVKPRRRRDGVVFYEIQRPDGSRDTRPAEEILHLRGQSLDGLEGVSVLTYARETIGAAIAAEHHGAGFFSRGARPSGALETAEHLSPEAYERLKTSIEEHQGEGNSGRTLILEEGLTFKPITMSAADAQFIESRGFTRQEICMFFGVPPHVLGDTEKQTSWGSGIEQLSIGFMTFSLRPWFRLWEGALRRDVIRERGLSARFDISELQLSDMKSAAESFAKLLSYSVLSPDEVRARFGYAAREDGRGGTFFEPPNTAGGGQPREETRP